MSVITMIPRQESGNIYNVLLYRALETVGLRYVQIPFSLRYLWRNGPFELQHYLHFHWPEIFFEIRPRRPDRLFGLKGYVVLTLFWLLAKLRGYRIVWTVHEVDVHDLSRHTWLHAASRRLLWRLTDIVFAHSPPVLAEATRRWGRKPHAHLIPIGSYAGAYEDTIDRQGARARLGLPEAAFVFVFFGSVRPYKGIDLLIDAFHAVRRDHADAHLVIAGKPYSSEFESEVRRRAGDDPNLHLVLTYIPDADVQVYLRAADCFVAPYKYIETCSAIYLALAFDLPVIIKSEGNVVDFADQPIGVFMADASETEQAMRRMLALTPAERAALRDRTRHASQLFAWEALKERYRKAFDTFERAHK
jgi:glycosyltransferase involved in cell wall biosynthesis